MFFQKLFLSHLDALHKRIGKIVLREMEAWLEQFYLIKTIV